MLSWNEAQTIDLSLRSIADFVDEVILVDTGSFDGTQDIALEWLDRLDLSGEIHQIKTKDMREARIKSLDLCTGDWILMQDAQLVLSEGLKNELLHHTKHYPRTVCAVKSLNLMGDYEHYFANRPWMAPHKIWYARDIPQTLERYRPKFLAPHRIASNWAVNLSRLRPAWRYWLRGEKFDRRYYGERERYHDEGHINKANLTGRWARSKRYHNLVEYVDAEIGLSLDDVRRIAPEWYLNLCRIEATPLSHKMREGLPHIIKEEIENPRYKLIYDGNEIVGRWPEL